MEHQVLLTIITPVYNAGTMIGRCIESVRNQHFESYEHLIFDGGSTDNTVEMVHQYMDPGSKIILISQKDKGVYDAMNQAIGRARGRWFYFLGADDYFYSDKVLTSMRSFLNHSSATILYGNVWYELYNRIYDGYFGMEKLLKRNICHQGMFFSNTVFKVIGLYNTEYKQEADYDFNLRCWIKGVETEFINETIAFYSKGGISDQGRDPALERDYPRILMDYLFQSRRSFFSKVNILSKIFRKILLRYPINQFWMGFSQRNHFTLKVLAVLWMSITFPFFSFLSFIFARK